MTDANLRTPDHELSFVTTERLFLELCRRHRGVLLTTVRDVNGLERREVSVYGGVTLCMGLAEVARNKMRTLQSAASLFDTRPPDQQLPDQPQEPST